MAKLILRFAKFLYKHISEFGLDYEDEDVKEFGSLINEMETKVEESEG